MGPSTDNNLAGQHDMLIVASIASDPENVLDTTPLNYLVNHECTLTTLNTALVPPDQIYFLADKSLS